MGANRLTGDVSVRRLSGLELSETLGALARLRIAIFREYPYLYDGDETYEASYLREFAAAPDAVLVVAIVAEEIVGAATASPMRAQKEEFRAPFAARGLDTDRLFYFGESVLLPAYRGCGIGHAFFDHREAAARAAGGEGACFAAIVRPDNHPARPDGYRPLDDFWTKRGYAPVEGLVTRLAWKEHGEEAENPKPMQYWLRRF